MRIFRRDQPEETPEEIEAQRKMDYRLAFGTPEGERVLADLLRHCHLWEPCYAPNGDTHETAYREGERNVALYVMNQISLPEERAKIVNEEVLDYA